ncbi:MAG: type II toxin-antitoxin system HicB family antitoxin [Deltaproteobacteria bacterium]|nr:type II toxin-antitoxin system HicB family antitoxin [Deltaproteobacteria bacterium]
MQTYRIVVAHSSSSDAFVARAPELSGCEAEGATRGEAVANLEAAMADQLANMREQGLEAPVPIDEEPADGELRLKVSATLHRDLRFLAREEGVELETLLGEVLTRAADLLRGRGGRSARGPAPNREGRPREMGGPRYHDIMENRADFIEYVRSLDQGGGGRGPRPGGGRRGPGGGGRR